MRGTGRFSDFDIDFETKGKPAEAWLEMVGRSAGDKVEVKAPQYFLRPDHKHGGRYLAYVEYAARSRAGEWYLSGISTTKADHVFLKFGEYPGGVLVAAGWLLEAARLAWRRKQRGRCDKDPNPTRGALVGLDELYECRPECEFHPIIEEIEFDVPRGLGWEKYETSATDDDIPF